MIEQKIEFTKWLYAYVLVHNRTNKVIVDAGISFNKKDIEPNPIYRDEYSVIEVPIVKSGDYFYIKE